MDWKEARDVSKDIRILVRVLKLSHIKPSCVFCYRSTGSKSRSYARIWSLPKIFQRALQVGPAYVIEVLSERFDRLRDEEKKKVLLHELLHIPKNFSGALLPHRGRGRRLESTVDKLFKDYKEITNS